MKMATTGGRSMQLAVPSVT